MCSLWPLGAPQPAGQPTRVDLVAVDVAAVVEGAEARMVAPPAASCQGPTCSIRSLRVNAVSRPWPAQPGWGFATASAHVPTLRPAVRSRIGL